MSHPLRLRCTPSVSTYSDPRCRLLIERYGIPPVTRHSPLVAYVHPWRIAIRTRGTILSVRDARVVIAWYCCDWIESWNIDGLSAGSKTSVRTVDVWISAYWIGSIDLSVMILYRVGFRDHSKGRTY